MARAPVACAVFAIAAAFGPVAVRAQSADDAMTHANRLAYDYAMTCFVANGVVLGDYQKRGDTVRAAASDANARRSFDTAKALGDKLGFSGDRVSQDFGLAQSRELPNLVKDPAYFQKSAATCKALGLM